MSRASVRAIPLVLLGALLGMILTAGADPIARREMALLVGAAGVVIGGAMALSVRWAAGVPLACVIAGVILVASDPAGSFDPSGPLDGPLGYKNANAAFFGMLAVASVVLAVRRRDRRARWGLIVLACTWAGLALGQDSLAAGVLLGLAVLGFFPHRRWPAVVLVGGLLASVAVPAALGAARNADPDGYLARSGARIFTERRLDLWGDALRVSVRDPLRGAGPGSFTALSPTARADRDARDPHSLVLGAAAELGWPAAALLVLTLLAAVGPPAWSGGAEAVLLAVGTCLFAVHAGIDQIARSPASVLVAASLAGAALAKTAPLGVVWSPPSAATQGGTYGGPTTTSDEGGGAS